VVVGVVAAGGALTAGVVTRVGAVGVVWVVAWAGAVTTLAWCCALEGTVCVAWLCAFALVTDVCTAGFLTRWTSGGVAAAEAREPTDRAAGAGALDAGASVEGLALCGRVAAPTANAAPNATTIAEPAASSARPCVLGCASETPEPVPGTVPKGSPATDPVATCVLGLSSASRPAIIRLHPGECATAAAIQARSDPLRLAAHVGQARTTDGLGHR